MERVCIVYFIFEGMEEGRKTAQSLIFTGFAKAMH